MLAYESCTRPGQIAWDHEIPEFIPVGRKGHPFEVVDERVGSAYLLFRYPFAELTFVMDVGIGGIEEYAFPEPVRQHLPVHAEKVAIDKRE